MTIQKTQFIKFRAMPGAGSVRIALTSGHIFEITEDDWAEIPSFAAREARAAGCMDEDQFNALRAMVESGQVSDEGGQKFDRAEEIKNAMLDILDMGDEKMFDKDGRPLVQILTDRCGFQVTANERNEIWTQLQTQG